MMRLAVALLCALISTGTATAHEVRPAYLELRETRPGEYAVLWKTPMQGDARLALEPTFSGPFEPITSMVGRRAANAAVQTWTARAETLRGQTIAIRGLEGTMTDVLVRIEFSDGTSWTHRLAPSAPGAVVPLRASSFGVAATYLKLGVEHILLGVDHLLFVLALLLIARGPWPLVKTITAFTVAHSITLGLAALGVVRVPQQPVEALIALSIAFVAVEIVRARQGRETLAIRAPWVVAFAFGLLHGLGFAGALTEAGLPEGRVPLALAFFNLGVEAGQLAFVGVVLAGLALARRVAVPSPAGAIVPGYVIGITAMFWVCERVAAF